MAKTPFRCGDIVLNKWAGHPEGRYFIFIKNHGTYSETVQAINGVVKHERQSFYTDSFSKPYYDGTPAYTKVGYVDLKNIIKEALKPENFFTDEQIIKIRDTTPKEI